MRWVDNTGIISTLEYLSFTINGFDKIYPNPAQHQLNIEYYSDTEPDIYIYDLNGKEVLKIKGDLNNLQTIDITNLESGIYFLQYISPEINTLEKFVIQK